MMGIELQINMIVEMTKISHRLGEFFPTRVTQPRVQVFFFLADCEREQGWRADDVAGGADATPLHARPQPNHGKHGKGAYRVEQKTLAKFSDACSVRADRLCIGSPRLVGGRKAGKFKHARIFSHHAVPSTSYF